MRVSWRSPKDQVCVRYLYRKAVRGAALGLSVAGILAAVVYRRDMRRAYERVRGKSRIVPSPFGNIEYAEGGAGPPVLVVHGSGGGFDQCQLIAESFLDDGLRWIAPSRFGYLRSTFQEGATFDEQAHAHVSLLDHLGVDKVAVVAFSHGGPSALVFAVLYPERVSSLTLVSTGVVTMATEEQGEASRKGNALTTIFKYDWLYWAISTLFKRQFMALMGASDTVIAGLTVGQKKLVERIIEEMNPVSLRTAGVAFDNGAALPGERIAAIEAPTLIVHATDDTLQRYHNAEFAAATIPEARLIRFEKGGHLLMAVEQAAIREEIRTHILEQANG